MTKEEIQSNIERIFETVNEVCQKAGISRQITIEAITKGVDMERILWAYECGINVMGENRVQEALLKIPFLNLDIEWHLVGHLQTNKVKHAVKIFRVIESVDRIELVGAMNKRLETPMEVFVEVNTSGEQQKTGCKIEEVHPLIEEILMREKLILTGLMTVGPYPVEEKRTRESFAKLYKTKEVIEKDFGINLKWLSMGMTEDYPYAILEGANLLRIGRGIFGGRL
ncbi:MAG TPA: YggS family pyridoxal phosphate-dependent enzyme [Candidatus Hydrothermia bacterium]|nr:YggS family pyridoxal phosphate-dependent enzyme [Candidatus Hydrothermae bacterium]MDD3649203.1 YggS family pyridoxal phosphate-dependent enzyme [Candidatus Hydrothermia bacterium]MDD5572407.1 YggS family pyridoxal phosphate-dependent enzyme [Candidatus Hydrothermia bacterium]HOP32545.1 YggS family pyridoxal phosphate-dependent enzyme [Candidatus Hydrothermia bacterium]HPO78490.1 YggS family pyridoxal phosphate-dependent enzyme [Candidatus Hydrothermia bacterium]